MDRNAAGFDGALATGTALAIDALGVTVVWAFALGALFGWVIDQFRAGGRP